MPPAQEASRTVRHMRAGPGDAGQRIDNFLMRTLKGVPRSHVYRLLRKGEVRINGRRARPEQRLEAGDEVRLPPVRAAEAGTNRAVPERVLSEMRQRILFQDARLLALDKPAGLAAHGGSGLAFGAIEALREAYPGSGLELAHRLDKDTSGVLLVARDRASLRLLHAALREGEVDKTYLALLQGRWTLGRKTIDAPLKTNIRQGGERMVKVDIDGRDSASTFRPVRRFGTRATLVEVDIHTGRTHQIRVHAAYAGHPVAGDEKYGDREFNGAMKALGLRRMFLHAHRVEFTWPDTGRRCRIEAPMPEELAAVLERLSQRVQSHPP
jgi:23S rRNA pseudouridine955/2504/2580 synthase